MFLRANHEFLKQREAEERVAANRCGCPRQKRIHLQMAADYACKARLMRRDVPDRPAL